MRWTFETNVLSRTGERYFVNCFPVEWCLERFRCMSLIYPFMEHLDGRSGKGFCNVLNMKPQRETCVLSSIFFFFFLIIKSENIHPFVFNRIFSRSILFVCVCVCNKVHERISFSSQLHSYTIMVYSSGLS